MEELFSFRTDRLTSRLQALLFSWRYARKFNARCTFIWPKPRAEYIADDTEHYEFSRIFDLPQLYAQSPDLRVADGPIPKQFQRLWKKHGSQIGKNPVVESLDAFRMGHFHVNGALLAFRTPDEDATQVLDASARLFAELPIRQRMLNLVEKEDPAEFTAIHIRRGDLVPYGREILRAYTKQDWPRMRAKFRMLMAKTVPLTAYREYLKEVRKPALFFSDDETVAQSLCSEAGAPGSRVYRTPKGHLYPIERDFVSMLVMGRCKEVVGGGSVYARFAARTQGSEQRDLRAITHWRDYVDMIWDECLSPEQDAEFYENREKYSTGLIEALRSDEAYLKSSIRITKRAQKLAPPELSG
ncbi:hypothetical protein [Croceicoccus gelatinilyticus]|uniref:hypothetical protein n=1 Tax=Croceicoccus gelatinilyticus TaxID=2835536 RepID=UPI001BCA71B5|nr:hypothetical protein [Croceicoccus gelatinilyticus]MBS7671192.1 hypothetical protein [Croceicoccus gelatinilyticus]